MENLSPHGVSRVIACCISFVLAAYRELVTCFSSRLSAVLKALYFTSRTMSLCQPSEMSRQKTRYNAGLSKCGLINLENVNVLCH